MKTSFDHKTAKETYTRFVKLKSSFHDSKTKLDAMFSKVENEAVCLIENGTIKNEDDFMKFDKEDKDVKGALK